MDSYTQESNDESVRIDEMNKKLDEKDKHITHINNLLKEAEGKAAQYSE